MTCTCRHTPQATNISHLWEKENLFRTYRLGGDMFAPSRYKFSEANYFCQYDHIIIPSKFSIDTQNDVFFPMHLLPNG